MDYSDIREQIRQHLLADERICWLGKPKQGLALSGRDALLIPFSLMWGGFALFWNVSVWTIPKEGNGPDLFFKLWGLPFLIVVIYFIFGRFLHDSALRKQLVYAVTNQRIIVARSANSTKFRSLDIGRLPRLDLSEHSDGTGTIEFESNPIFTGSGMNGFGLWVPSLSSVVQFFKVENPRQVYEVIRNQSRAA